MRKISLILVAVLLMAGVAQAAEWTQLITEEYSARNIGRSIATDSSVIIKVWNKDGVSAHPGVGVSSSTSLIIYTDYTQQEGITIDTASTTYDTVGEIVDYINTNLSSDSSVKLFASVGPDAHRNTAATTLVPANIVDTGITRDGSTGLVYKQTNDRITAGIEAKDGTVNRIKRLNVYLPILPSGVGTTGITLRIYDGTTLVWRKFVPASVWNTATDPSNSGNSVVFPDVKGISSTAGNGLVAEGVVDTVQPNCTTSERSAQGINIIYDQVRQ